MRRQDSLPYFSTRVKAHRKQIIRCIPLQIASCPNVSQKSLKPQCLSPYDTF